MTEGNPFRGSRRFPPFCRLDMRAADCRPYRIDPPQNKTTGLAAACKQANKAPPLGELSSVRETERALYEETLSVTLCVTPLPEGEAIANTANAARRGRRVLQRRVWFRETARLPLEGKLSSRRRD